MARRKNKYHAVSQTKHFGDVKEAIKKYAGSASTVHDKVQTMDIDKRVNKDFTKSTNAVIATNSPPLPPPYLDMQMQAIEINNLQAAVRFYIVAILKFDKSRTKFPYSAYVETGKFDENYDKVYEPAAVLAVSYNREELEHPLKRCPKPKKRRSDVIHDLARPEKRIKLSSSKKKNNKLKEVQISNQPKQQLTVTRLLENISCEIMKLIHLLFLQDNNVDAEDISLAELKRQLDALKTLEPVQMSNEPKGSFSVLAKRGSCGWIRQ
uniref:Uncharacterized protein n=1 Tax=Trichogramma kaykai TaxID=54128 RepID=A0ABD2WY33_9HYME